MKTELALVGDPIGQSLSPAIQEAALRAVGLDWHYRLVPVGRGELAGRWSELTARYLGLNVTVPLKEEAVGLVDRLSPGARLCGSLNTIVCVGASSVGHSTDGQGFLSALARSGPVVAGEAVILGSGGAARAVVAALLGQGWEVTVLARSEAGAVRLRTALAEVGTIRTGVIAEGTAAAALARADLLVNATTVGGPSATALSPLPSGIRIPPRVVVFDLVYSPRQTPLLLEARRAGCRVVEGIEMLVEQGALAFQLFTGRVPPIEVMRSTAYQALPLQAAVGS